MSAEVTHRMRVKRTARGRYILFIDGERQGVYKREKKAWKNGCKIMSKILDAEIKIEEAPKTRP